MKRTVIFLLLYICIVSGIAQDSKLSVGFELTPASVWLRGNLNAESLNSDIGLITGLTLDYKLVDQIGLKTGITFDSRGAKSSEPAFDQLGNESGTAEIKLNYNYLGIPVIGSLNLLENRFYIDGGFNLLFLINENHEGPESHMEALVGPKGENSTNSFDVAFTTGFGGNFPMGERFIFTAGLQLSLGLTNISSVPVVGDGSIKTNSLGLKMGLKYTL